MLLRCWASVGAPFLGGRNAVLGKYSAKISESLWVWVEKFESNARKGPALASVGAIFVNMVGLYRQQSFLLKWGYYSLLWYVALGNG